MSAPNLMGCWKYGDMKVLSTTTSQTTLVGDLADGGDVGETHQRIGRRFDIDITRVLADGALYVARIGGVHVSELQAEVRHDLVEQPGHAAIEIVGGDNVVARLHQLAQRADRSHSAGKNRRGDAAFQRRKILLQPRARGIAGARIVVALGLAQFFLSVGRGGKDGRSDGSGGWVGFIADMDGASRKAGNILLRHRELFHHRGTELENFSPRRTRRARKGQSNFQSCEFRILNKSKKTDR